RRQAMIGPFIVDFASRKTKLVIELDGGQHDAQRAADDARTRKIEARGYRLLRFWNHDVLGNLVGVLSEIQNALPPPPTPWASKGSGVGVRGDGQLADERKPEKPPPRSSGPRAAMKHVQCNFRRTVQA